MFATLVVIAMALAPHLPMVDGSSPADGLGLEPTTVTPSPVLLPAGGIPATAPSDGPSPGRPPFRAPVIPSGAALGGAALALSAVARHRRRDDEPLYVVVHGHGGSAGDFDRLLASMGVPAGRVRAFDYRTVARADSSADASRRVSTAGAASSLDALIRALAVRHDNIYTIHHSRGGAVGVEMIAALDAGERQAIPAYRGAALLDPAIATGAMGWLQRLGGPIPAIPDNGGFDPSRCSVDSCHDVRSGLGEESGVKVVAIRNPDAVVTNFTDRPSRLRTLDLVDDGEPTALASWWSLPAFVARVFEAHGSVLHHAAVSDCVLAESTTAGPCAWKGHRRLPKVWWGRGRTTNLVR